MFYVLVGLDKNTEEEFFLVFFFNLQAPVPHIFLDGYSHEGVFAVICQPVFLYLRSATGQFWILIVDGNSEHVAHVCRKIVFFRREKSDL